MKLKYLAAIWGLAEATVFFIVPDVLLTFVACKEGKRVTGLCLWALAGALVGGCIMFGWGFNDKESAENLLVRIPAVDHDMLLEIEKQVHEGGTKALFIGPITGRPYKAYATYAGTSEVNAVIFFLVSIPARILRFLALAWLSTAISKRFLRQQSDRTRTLLPIAIWVAFYAWYFSVT